MWYDDPFVKFSSRKRKNRRVRRSNRGPILMVNARMLDQKRERMQRYGSLLLIAAALVASGWLVVQGGRFFGRLLFSHNPLYTITSFDVSSDGHRIPAALLLEFAELKDGMNLFSVNLRDVTRRLEEVSLVQRARASRELPGTLKIRVTERVAVARLGPENSRYPLAIDREGVVLGRRSRTPNLPLITGADYLMTGPDDKQLRPGKRVADERIMDALKVIHVCDDNPQLARVLNLISIDVSDDDDLVFSLPPRVPGQGENREGRIARDLDFESQIKELAATLHYADATGRAFTEFNFTVKKNQAVQ